MLELTIATFGRINILVNVADLTSFGSIEASCPSRMGPRPGQKSQERLLCYQVIIAPMRRQKHGRIINIGSILAKNGGSPRPWINLDEQLRASNVTYGAAKAGVHAMTGRSRSNRLGDDIGFPDSLCALIRLGRLGRPKMSLKRSPILPAEQRIL